MEPYEPAPPLSNTVNMADGSPVRPHPSPSTDAAHSPIVYGSPRTQPSTSNDRDEEMPDAAADAQVTMPHVTAGKVFDQPPPSVFGQPPPSVFGQPPTSVFDQPPSSVFGQPPPSVSGAGVVNEHALHFSPEQPRRELIQMERMMQNQPIAPTTPLFYLMVGNAWGDLLLPDKVTLRGFQTTTIDRRERPLFRPVMVGPNGASSHKRFHVMPIHASCDIEQGYPHKARMFVHGDRGTAIQFEGILAAGKIKENREKLIDELWDKNQHGADICFIATKNVRDFKMDKEDPRRAYLDYIQAWESKSFPFSFQESVGVEAIYSITHKGQIEFYSHPLGNMTLPKKQGYGLSNLTQDPFSHMGSFDVPMEKVPLKKQVHRSNFDNDFPMLDDDDDDDDDDEYDPRGHKDLFRRYNGDLLRFEPPKDTKKTTEGTDGQQAKKSRTRAADDVETLDEGEHEPRYDDDDDEDHDGDLYRRDRGMSEVELQTGLIAGRSSPYESSDGGVQTSESANESNIVSALVAIFVVSHLVTITVRYLGGFKYTHSGEGIGGAVTQLIINLALFACAWRLGKIKPAHRSNRGMSLETWFLQAPLWLMVFIAPIDRIIGDALIQFGIDIFGYGFLIMLLAWCKARKVTVTKWPVASLGVFLAFIFVFFVSMGSPDDDDDDSDDVGVEEADSIHLSSLTTTLEAVVVSNIVAGYGSAWRHFQWLDCGQIDAEFAMRWAPLYFVMSVGTHAVQSFVGLNEDHEFFVLLVTCITAGVNVLFLCRVVAKLGTNNRTIIYNNLKRVAAAPLAAVLGIIATLWYAIDESRAWILVAAIEDAVGLTAIILLSLHVRLNSTETRELAYLHFGYAFVSMAMTLAIESVSPPSLLRLACTQVTLIALLKDLVCNKPRAEHKHVSIAPFQPLIRDIRHSWTAVRHRNRATTQEDDGAMH